jgi:hypothetical protein
VVLNHLAAMLFFAGPLFYVGIWMAVDPGGLVGLLDCIVRRFDGRAATSGGPVSQDIVERERAHISNRIRTGVRVAGVVLTLVAIAV